MGQCGRGELGLAMGVIDDMSKLSSGPNDAVMVVHVYQKREVAIGHPEWITLFNSKLSLDHSCIRMAR